MTALNWACREKGRHEVVRALIEAGATVDTQDKVSQIGCVYIILLTMSCHSQYGQTPLYLASSHGHQNYVELLIQTGANVDVPRQVSIMLSEIIGHLRDHQFEY